MFVRDQVIFLLALAAARLTVSSLFTYFRMFTCAGGVIYLSWEENKQPLLPKYSHIFMFVAVFNWVKFSVLSFLQLKATN